LAPSSLAVGSAPPLSPIGLTAAGLFAGVEVLKGGLRVYINQALLPVLVALRSQHALDAVPEAYHNLAAVCWGAFAASVVIRDQVVPVKQGSGSPGVAITRRPGQPAVAGSPR
jgi:hypothetical protein